MDTQLTAYNMRTQQYEPFDGNWRDCIPQIPPALGMFDLLVEIGDSEVEAARRVLEASLGKSATAKKEGE